MPVKNASSYLRKCIDSIIGQSIQDWELIAINDHSTDDSYDILNTYSKQDNRITVTNNEGVGIIPALKLAYKKTSGKYITRMDADDIMSPNKLEVLYNLLHKSGRQNIATGHVKYFSSTPLGEGYIKYQDWLNRLCINNTHFSEIYKECVIPSPCWMIHREDFDLCGGFENDTYPEDYDLCFRFYHHGMNVVSSKEILHYWRDYPIRSSRTDENYKDNRFLQLKTEYFLKIDYNKDSPLYLWGAGKKSKNIARILIENKIQFNWISNNIKKIGKDIYGIIIKDQSQLQGKSQVIIAIANEKEQNEINQIIKEFEDLKYYHFS